MAEISLFDPAMIVWVDESGFNRRNTIIRSYGYSLRGMRAIDHQLKHGMAEYVSIPLECHILVLKMYTSWKTQLMVMHLKIFVGSVSFPS